MITDDWHIGGQDIEDLRMVFSEAAGLVGVRSPQAGIEAAAMYAKIERPTELRCGPIYVRNPSHAGSGYELTDQHVRTVARIQSAERIIRSLHKSLPGALQVLKAVYVQPGARGLELFDTEQGEHGARLSNLVAPNPEPRLRAVRSLFAAAESTHPVHVWLLMLCSRVTKARNAHAEPDAADLSGVKQIAAETNELLVAASRAWHAARTSIRERRG